MYNFIPTYPLLWGFPGGSVVKNLPANSRDARDSSLIPGSERTPGVGNGISLQYSCLGNPRDRGVWRATVHGVVPSQTQLSMHTHSRLLVLLFLFRSSWWSASTCVCTHRHHPLKTWQNYPAHYFKHLLLPWSDGKGKGLKVFLFVKWLILTTSSQIERSTFNNATWTCKYEQVVAI